MLGSVKHISARSQHAINPAQCFTDVKMVQYRAADD
jgi:hypothetical protein